MFTRLRKSTAASPGGDKVKKLLCLASCLIGLSYWLAVSSLFAASVSPGLSKAKQEAESKGYLFITSKDEIVAKAKQEHKLEVLTFLEADAKKAMSGSLRFSNG